MKIATKPLRPKNIYSRFSISRFLKEYDYPEYLIIWQNEFKKLKAKDSKHARVNSESVTQVKKF